MDTQDLLFSPDPSTYSHRYSPDEQDISDAPAFFGFPADAPSPTRTHPKLHAIMRTDNTPHLAPDPGVRKSEIRDSKTTTDQNWGIRGKKYDAVDLRKKLRMRREGRKNEPDRELRTEDPKKAIVNPLALAKEIVGGVSRLVRNTSLQPLTPILSVLAEADFMSGDPTLTPTSVGADRYLGIYLHLGDNSVDFSCYEGELYCCGDDMVFTSTKIPPILTSEEAEILSAIEGLFIYSPIEKKEISTTSLIEILLSVIEIERPNSAESLLRFMRNVLRRNWDFSKV